MKYWVQISLLIGGLVIVAFVTDTLVKKANTTTETVAATKVEEIDITIKYKKEASGMFQDIYKDSGIVAQCINVYIIEKIEIAEQKFDVRALKNTSIVDVLHPYATIRMFTDASAGELAKLPGFTLSSDETGQYLIFKGKCSVDNFKTFKEKYHNDLVPPLDSIEPKQEEKPDGNDKK